MRLHTAVTLLLLAFLAACGGGSGSQGACSGSAEYCQSPISNSISSPNTPATQTTGSTAPYFEPALPSGTSVARQCLAPRPASARDPFNNQLYGDKQGNSSTEKLWLRAFVNDTYLWYKDVVPTDPARYVVGATVAQVSPSDNAKYSLTLNSQLDVVDAYFNSLRSQLVTSSGKPKDQFHFIYPTEDWVAQSKSGSSVGFGFQVALIARKAPRSAFVAYVDPNTPAALQNLSRGAEFISINGVPVVDGDSDAINEGLFAPLPGKAYTFKVRDQGSSTDRTLVLSATTVVSTPVQNVQTLPAPNNSVGYMLFNDHIATAESQLIAAVNQLKAANNGSGISDLVLDLRYNGGGYLDIASELAYMIAGAPATQGKAFEKLSFNDKNPYNQSEAQLTTPFHSRSQGFSTPEGQPLPQLGLTRVFVIASSGTCSASEAILNGLTGIGIQVILIGGTTCGKPYGFFPQDNCGVTYFTVQFKGVNQLGFGDYADGFVPGANTGQSSQGNLLPGCVVPDDFTKALGDPAEGRLAAALQYRTNGSCVPASSALKGRVSGPGSDPYLGRSAPRENRIYRSPGNA